MPVTVVGRASRRRRPSGEPPPLPRELNRAGVAWLAAFGFWAVVWALVFFNDEPGEWITRQDNRIIDLVVDGRAAWLTDLFDAAHRIGTHLLVPALSWTVIGVCALNRRFRRLLVYLGCLLFVSLLLTFISSGIERPRPLGVDILGEWDGWAHPSRPVALMTVGLMGMALVVFPDGPWRNRWYWAMGVLLLLFGYGQVYLGVDHPTDVVVSVTIGVAVTLTAFRVFVPEGVFPLTYGKREGAHLQITTERAAAIVAGVRDQLGLHIDEIEPFGLAGSAGSTPLLLRSADSSTKVFAKLYARSHLRSDRWYKLGRTLLYGRLEDEHPFTSVRRLVQHEDYMLRLVGAAGIECPASYGVVEMTPGREYLIVTDFLEGAVEMGEAQVDELLIDEALAVVRRLWEAGIAHRDVKPANVMTANGRVMLVDVAFAQVRPSPWRQAVDLANMMLVLALRSSPELVYERALRQFSPAEVAEAFAASRGITMPSQLRHDVKRDARDLLEQFRELAPAAEPVSIQRWSLRRLGLAAAVAFGLVAAVSITIDSLSALGLTGSPADNLVLSPLCDSGVPLLAAQGVPSATQVPCMDGMPEGWWAEQGSVDENGMTLTLDSDRAGEAAVRGEYAETCELLGAVAVPSRFEGVDQYERVLEVSPSFRSVRSYVFVGGCLTLEFDFDAGASGTLSVEVADRLVFFSRADLQRDVSETFIDRRV